MASSPVPWLDFVNAISTTVVALFAVVQVGKLFWDDYRRRSEVDARLSTQAYALRRHLGSWLADAPTLDVKLIDRAMEITSTPAEAMPSSARRAEDRILEMVIAAPEASAARAKAVRSAYILFYKAMNQINAQVTREVTLHSASEDELYGAFENIREAVDQLFLAIDPDIRELDSAYNATPSPGLLGRAWPPNASIK